MAVLNLCPAEVDLCFSRGDTVPWTFTIKNKTTGAVINITGFSYRLTVDPSETPSNSNKNLFVLTGTITDAPNGIVEFAMTATQADQTPDVYFFDLEQTDAGLAIRTVARGKYEFQQDISK